MTLDKTFGWLMILLAAYMLLIAIFTGDMNGLTSLGYNPDLPMTLGRAPLRFLGGIVLHVVIGVYGIRLISGAASLRRED